MRAARIRCSAARTHTPTIVRISRAERHWDPQFAKLGTGINPNLRLDRLKDAARNVTVPTLLVRGGRSPLVSTETIEEFLALMAYAEYVNVAEADDMVAGDGNDGFTRRSSISWSGP